MSEKVANDPANPWSINYFAPPTPHVKAPTPPQFKPKTPYNLPELDRLFAAQDDLVRAVNALHEVEDGMRGQKEPHGFRMLRVNVENAYRVLNRYLKDYGSTGGSIT